MAVLEQLAEGGRVVAVFEIPVGGGVLGRGKGVEMFIAEPSVSRRHAQLVRHEAGWMIVSLSAANRVKVEGVPVESKVLVDGDRVTAGTIALRFRVADVRAQPTRIETGGPAPSAPPSPPTQRRVPEAEPGFFARHGAETIAALVLVGLGGAFAWWYAMRPAEPAGGPATANDAAPNPTSELTYVRWVVPEEGGRFEGDGFSLEVGAEVFPARSALQIRSRPDVAVPEGMRLLAPPIEVDTHGRQPMGDVVLRVPVEAGALPKGERPLVVSPVGEGKLRVYPSYYDRRTHEVVARVHHFSLVLVGWGIAAGLAGKLVWDGVQWAYVASRGEDLDDYPGHYVSPGGVHVYFDPAMFAQHSATPRYVLDAGARFDDALREFATRPAFASIDLTAANLPPVVIVDRVGDDKPTGAAADIMWGNATAGETPPNLADIEIQLGLGPRLLAQTAIHEASHVWQIRSVGWKLAGASDWWREASAEWVGWTAYPVVTRSSNAQHFPGVDHITEGFHGSVGKNAAYSLGDFAMYVDGLCPGVVLKSWRPGGFVSLGTHWYPGLEALIDRECQLDLQDVLGDYLVRHGLPIGTPRGPGRLGKPEFFPDTLYVRHATDMPAVSGSIRGLRLPADVGLYTLVVRDATGHEVLNRLWYGRMPAGGSSVRNPPDGHDVTGSTALWPAFGGPRARPPGTANLVGLISANPTEQEVSTDVELYLLAPPTRPKGSVKTVGSKAEVSLSWIGPRLAYGSRASDAGALAKVRVYQRLSGVTRQVAEVDAKRASYSGTPNLMWDRNRATLVLRAVDKYGNESEDSAPIDLRRRPATIRPARKPTRRTKTPPKPRPSNPCKACNMSGPECGNTNRSSRCWSLGCCE